VAQASGSAGRQRTIVTSALPYINGVKHLGNLVGSMLPADVYARHLRQLGEEVLYVCGTDEHGTPAELSAQAEGLPVAEYCEKYWGIQKQIYERFSISFDVFGRTSAPETHEETQQAFLDLHRKGFVVEREMEQLYCEDDQRYLPDRFVHGECPNCGSEEARGDQCESCGKLLDPGDLVRPRCHADPAHKLVVRSEKHLFLDLPKLQGRVSDWLETKQNWPATTLGIARGFLKEGLQERCITRSLEWGVPVPLAGYEDKVFYVWFDAPMGYIGITREWAEKVAGDREAWRRYWLDPDTRLVQFMGKDNVPFHTVTWPATVLGADRGFITAWIIKGFHWLQYEGGKFSTSKGRGIFSDDAIELFPADFWRYYLLSVAPEKADTNFTWKGFQGAVNKDLADVLGNLLSRVARFVVRYFDGRVPPVGPAGPGDTERDTLATFAAHEADFSAALEACEMASAVRSLRAAWASGNKYLDLSEPWNLRKTDMEACGTVMNTCVHLIRRSAVLASPVVPNLARGIVDALGLEGFDPARVTSSSLGQSDLTGHSIPSEQQPLVRKIEDEVIEELQQRFSGGG
jgi:methionyl-tRNA synthetase